MKHWLARYPPHPTTQASLKDGKWTVNVWSGKAGEIATGTVDDASGLVTESFAPDFYLPQVDLYVELTTLKQSLVRKKNRKLRWMRLLYPEVRVKLLYARDFKALMIKYGRHDFMAQVFDANLHNGTGPMTPDAPPAARVAVTAA